MINIKKVLSATLITALLFTGCANNQSSSTDATGGSTESTTTAATSSGASQTGSTSAYSPTVIGSSDMFTNRDKEVGYDESKSVKLTLSGDSITSSSDSVTISGSTATITVEGTYILSGALDDGMIIVNADDTAKIQLVLDNVTVNSSTSAAVYVCSADKVFITLASGSENTLSNGGEYVAIDDNNIDSVIFSKSDLTLNGNGTLDINAEAGHGIVSKDDLVITSGTYVITAASHGLSAKDSIRIADGSFTIISGKDGIHSDNDEDTELGNVYIAGGSYDIDAEGDGVSASGYLLADNGTFDITTDNDDSDTSTKGLKASGSLTINAGTYVINTVDDALHTNSDMTINGGVFTIATGDDGLHADNDLVVNNGEITINDCYEGLEGLTVTVNDGTISINASDDGINAAGGNDSSGFGGFFGGDNFSADSDANIYINGGIINIDADGDGIDSNGNLYITGGEVYVSGPESNADGALDYDGESSITGGILIAAGASDMALNMGSDSTQGTILVSFTTQAAGTTISLSDESGNELIAWTSDKTYSSVVISTPDITTGSTYTIKAGDYETTITMDSLVYGSGMGGFPGGGGGMGENRPDGNGGMGGNRPDGNGGMGGQKPDRNNDSSGMTPPDMNSDNSGMTPPDVNGNGDGV